VKTRNVEQMCIKIPLFLETNVFETNVFETDVFETNVFETDVFETNVFEIRRLFYKYQVQFEFRNFPYLQQI
jgi:hypothetical protein